MSKNIPLCAPLYHQKLHSRVPAPLHLALSSTQSTITLLMMLYIRLYCYFNLASRPPSWFTKGQIKPKAVWARRRFSQKTNKQICFVSHKKQKSKQNEFVRLFFGRIYGAPIWFWFYLTFKAKRHVKFQAKKWDMKDIFIIQEHMYTDKNILDKSY